MARTGMLKDERHGTGGGPSLMDDSDLLWKVRTGEAANIKLTVPRVLVPGVLELVLSTPVHPGIAWKTVVVSGNTAGQLT